MRRLRARRAQRARAHVPYSMVTRPLAILLETCDSPQALWGVLRMQARYTSLAFAGTVWCYRNGWIRQTMSYLSTLSARQHAHTPTRLIERIYFFLQRLNSYTQDLLKPQLSELLAMILAEILFMLPLPVRGRGISELIGSLCLFSWVTMT
jgi:hypothetical protein